MNRSSRPPPPALDVRTIGSLPNLPDSTGRGALWFSGIPSGGCYYNHVMPPNGNNCVYSCTPTANHPSRSHWCGALTAGSRHPGMVNVLMADGSVRGIKETIAVETWRALGTRNGGEVVSASDY
jgi:prepilin-type processing-associated H-X9-DG protein